jgi:hypothetical protein
VNGLKDTGPAIVCAKNVLVLSRDIGCSFYWIFENRFVIPS